MTGEATTADAAAAADTTGTAALVTAAPSLPV